MPSMPNGAITRTQFDTARDQFKDRFLIDGQSVDFAQVVVAQQTLGQVVTNYMQSLTDAWMATVDLAELLQVDDLLTMDGHAVDK